MREEPVSPYALGKLTATHYLQKCSKLGFLNTVNSLHGVTPRENPTSVRRYVNLDCHVQEKLFKFLD